MSGLPIQLSGIDTAFLTRVVRQDQRSPRFEITSWSLRHLSDKGVINPDGLWLFSGEGYDQSGSRSWSLVLKTFQRPTHETSPSDLWYWKRELLLAQSGLLERLQGPIKAPRFYHSLETVDGAWLWQEYVKSNYPDKTWGFSDYAFAAYQLGYWNGTCTLSVPIPEEPWLARRHCRSWYSDADPERDCQFYLNRKYITGEIQDRYKKLWGERAKFYQILDDLPQTFSHFDSQRRNLFIRHGDNAQDELVLIDWAQCGIGPLGAEIATLVTGSTILREWPPILVRQLDTAVYGQYLQGLRDAGWSGDTSSVRLAYLAWITVVLGVVFPSIIALCCTPESRQDVTKAFGAAEEELCCEWLPLLSYALDCADEARSIMKAAKPAVSA